MLHVCTWRWGTKYGPDYVAKLFAGLHRHLRQPFTPWVLGPEPADRHLIARPGCFARLRMFDPGWQAAHGLESGDRLVCLDLDLIVTGQLDPLFDRPEPFCILKGANAANPCPFNGSVMMLRADAHPEVWRDFSLEAAAKVPFYEFPDDQGWLHHKIPDAAVWSVGRPSGVYAFRKPGWDTGEDLPADARIVCFPGRRDPSQVTHLPWVREHWQA